MLQRIQTVYLFLALILVSLSLFNLELYQLNFDDRVISVTAFSVSEGNISSSNSLWLYGAVTVLGILFSIFTFKDRKKQLMMSKVTLALAVLTAVWIIVTGYGNAMQCTTCNASSVTFSFATYAYAVSIPLIIMGILGIRKDKKLVDSLNRLR